MIRCAQCEAPIPITRERQPLVRLGVKIRVAEETYEHRFRLCLLLSLPTHCAKCGVAIDADMFEERLPVESLISEGAKLMSERNPARFNKDSGAAAAQKRFLK